MNIPKTLKDQLAAHRVIPFVGAGVSMAIRHKETQEKLFPSWKELLFHAADRLKSEGKHRDDNYIRAGLDLDNPDFLAIAEHAKKQLGSNWATFLKDEFNHSQDNVCENSLDLPKLIWDLGSRLIITTNYDKVLRWSCRDAGDCETWNIEHKAELAQFLSRQDAEKPTVWHLHGSIEDASRIILAQDGYKPLYSDDNTERVYDAALHTLRSVISSHTILFIGCSFNDKHLGMQFKGINRIFDGCTGPHYALIREEEKTLLKGLTLPIEPLLFSDFGQPLLDSLGELTRLTSGSASPVFSVAVPPPTAVSSPSIPPVGQRYHPSNSVFHVPFAQKGSQVIGRDETLDKVRQQLVEGRKTSIGHTASFKGLGGLGKTQFAVEYAYQYRNFYPNGVIWLHADQDIDAQLTELAVVAEWIAPESEHKDKLYVAKQRLRSHGNCLIIFDNLEDQAMIRPYLPGPGVTTHILVTSRLEQPGFTSIPLDPLSPERSLELLYQDADRKADGSVEESAAREIVTILGGLPLAIELAGAYLCHRKSFSFSDYLARLVDDPFKALPEKYLSSFTGHDPDLYRTLKINEELCVEEPLLTPILDLLTWSGPASMGIDLMAQLLDKTQSELNGALALGIELRIVQKSPGMDRFAIHRLVREVRKVESPIPNRMGWVEGIASKLGDWFQALREDFKKLPLFEGEIDHLVAWCNNCQTLPRLNARLIWLQAYPPYHRAKYQEAYEIVKLALSMVDEDNTKPNELNANIYSDFGVTLECLGDFKRALRYKVQALEIQKDLFGNDHHETATSYDNVGQTYGRLGDIKKGLEFQQKSLDIRRVLFGEDHHETATSYDNVGHTYGALGDNKMGLEFQQKALDIRYALFGEDHPDTATSYDNVGQTYGALGDNKKALEFQQKSLDIRRALFGEDHPVTATSYNNVGHTYGALGDNKKALEFQQKSLDISRVLFGEDHPETATSYNNVGHTYGALGDNKKALEFQQKALDIRNALFGEDHPVTAYSYNNIGSTYGALGDNKKALEFQQKALDIRNALFDEDHPNTANSYNNVGSTYGALGDHKKALEFQQKALDIRNALFGEDHPDTATSYNNVGSTYGALGDHKKALEYQKKALDIRYALFGEDHPDIVQSLHNSGMVLYALGKSQIATEFLRKAQCMGKRLLPNNHSLLIRIENALKMVRSNTNGFRAVPRKKKRR